MKKYLDVVEKAMGSYYMTPQEVLERESIYKQFMLSNDDYLGFPYPKNIDKNLKCRKNENR
jgi:hypothetical protein